MATYVTCHLTPVKMKTVFIAPPAENGEELHTLSQETVGGELLHTFGLNVMLEQ